MEMYTWASLGTTAGATAATLLVVQYLKEPLDRLIKLPTRILVLIVAFLVLLGAEAFGADGLHWSEVPLEFVNSFLVALSAMGAYENTFKRVAKAPVAVHNKTPVAEPGDEPDDLPDDEPVNLPGDEPDDLPADEPIAEPGDEPDDLPDVEPIDEPSGGQNG